MSLADWPFDSHDVYMVRARLRNPRSKPFVIFCGESGMKKCLEGVATIKYGDVKAHSHEVAGVPGLWCFVLARDYSKGNELRTALGLSSLVGIS